MYKLFSGTRLSLIRNILRCKLFQNSTKALGKMHFRFHCISLKNFILQNRLAITGTEDIPKIERHVFPVSLNRKKITSCKHCFNVYSCDVVDAELKLFCVKQNISLTYCPVACSMHYKSKIVMCITIKYLLDQQNLNMHYNQMLAKYFRSDLYIYIYISNINLSILQLHMMMMISTYIY